MEINKLFEIADSFRIRLFIDISNFQQLETEVYILSVMRQRE